jgi:hypothetical protein
MTKNRIPTDKEAEIVRRMIETSAKRITELDSEISSLRTEAEGYRLRLNDASSALQMAKKIHGRATATIASLKNLDSSLYLSQTSSESDKEPNLVSHSTYKTGAQLQGIDQNLNDAHNEYLQSAQSALSKASLQIRRAEEEIEVNQSLIFCVEETLSSLKNLQDETKNQIGYLKDLVGARRRVPGELWLRIFEETVKGDEETYRRGDRVECPPFSVLKLTWVCQHWRMLVINQPSLWRYIAIPCGEEFSSDQEDRIDYFIEHLKQNQPIVYMSHLGEEDGYSDSYPDESLKRFTSYKCLELYISKQHSRSEKLLTELQPHVERLVLFGRSHEEFDSAHAYLTCIGIQNVQSILCSYVRPEIDQEEEILPLNLKFLRLTQSDISNAGFVTFLGDSSVVAVDLEITSPFEIVGGPVDTETILPNLTTLTANLTILATLFNDQVTIPNLQKLTVLQEPTMTSDDAKTFWASFITTHQRKDTISTLGISGSPLVEEPDAPSLYQEIISRVANVGHLMLEGAAVVPALQGMTAARDIPSKLMELTISKSENVTKGHIDAFMGTLRTTRSKRLSVRIEDCPSLPKEILQQIIFDNDITGNIGDI